jgi:hypothetical protein
VDSKFWTFGDCVNRNAWPPKYDAERAARIVEAVRHGASRTGAAAAGGVEESTLYAWMQLSQQFSLAIKNADAEAEMAMVAVIRTAADEGTWHVAARWLERRHPEHWRQRHFVVGAAPPEELAKGISLEARQRILDLYGFDVELMLPQLRPDEIVHEETDQSGRRPPN